MTAGAAVEGLTLSLGAFRLKKIDFAVSRGEILVILGPNGAGKSVTLETIAGFHRPEGGRILIGGGDVTALPPERRNVGFVVQNFGLFPHLSVAQNVAIAQRRDGAVARTASVMPPHGDAAALLDYFGIAHLAQRAPSDLSPGEKQRVTLARALASKPELFLFDEPFSALDAEAHQQLRDELKSYLRALAIPAIFVSHDRSDALALADKVVVLRDGVIMQSGPAGDAFRKPANSFVARFFGVENVLSGRIVERSDSSVLIEVGKQKLRAAAPAKTVSMGRPITLAIRAEDARVCLPQETALPSPLINRLQGCIASLRCTGPLATLGIDCGFPLKAYLLAPQSRVMNLGEGSAVAVEIAADDVHLMME
jgi:molybdate/tungstate transport system ATP-binding protein